ncbi:hypothetical protein MKQ68_14345 [Chitinophaga horti]|uniref:Uncharacterized protein n=1 Tax=Chitinophaga horti TaxID=2920382 RepID=A0ABY6IZ35_9BACT|nr:hypothetical protein [Chitinophaga horti]UYQ91269.1 hypothetical protein MKQ68_14345 [Chitinophaga horti]
MKYRAIVVPKTKEAEQSLDYDKVMPEQLLEVVLDEDEFDNLLAIGFFERINSIAGSNIDDYEDENITDEEKLKEILRSEIFSHSAVTNKLSQLRNLFEEAIKRKTGIYFYF